MSTKSNFTLKIQNNIVHTIGKINVYLGFLIILISVIAFLTVSNLDVKKENVQYRYVQIENQILLSELFQTIPEQISETSFNLNLRKINIPSSSAETEGNKIVISKIGLDTFIYESYNPELGLEKGVWRDPTKGRPDLKALPTVLFAHRWGYDNLTNEYRKKNLFLYIPLLIEGDVIKLEWYGEEIYYKVLRVEVSEFAKSNADLILVTCRDYTSTLRYIVYANKQGT